MEKVKKYSNGLTLITSEDANLSCVFSIMIGVGSINENNENNGISHYIEHMSFKGTKNLSAFDIPNKMDFNGANFNAYTSTETTCFYAQSIKENLENTFMIMADAVFNSIYPDNEAEKEKNVIIEEINMSEDSPDDVCFDLSNKAFFGEEGYGRTILGTVKNVESFTLKDVKDYVSKYYVAENIVISFAGNVTEELADSLVNKYVLPYVSTNEKGKSPKYNTQNLKGKLFKEKDIEQVHMCLSFPSLSYLDENKIHSEMAVSLLGGGMSSRLFTRVREELGLAYSVYSFASRCKDVGTVNIYAGVNQDKYKNAFDEILKTIETFKKNGISDEEFLKVKNGLKASTLFSLEKPMTKVQLLSKYYLMNKKLYDYKQRILDIDNVKKIDVEERAKEFDIQNMATAVVGKKVKPLII